MKAVELQTQHSACGFFLVGNQQSVNEVKKVEGRPWQFQLRGRRG